LSTIIDYDRLLVLSNGKIQEFDTPWNLLNRDSVFKVSWFVLFAGKSGVLSTLSIGNGCEDRTLQRPVRSG
jgi:hypothetical protein